MFPVLQLVRCVYRRRLGQQPPVSLTRSGLFMKSTKTLPVETKAIWLPGDQYATVHHPGEFLGHMKCCSLKKERGGGWGCSNTILGGFQLHISLERDSTAFLSPCQLGSTDSFVSMLSRSVYAQSAHSYSVAMDTKPACITLSQGGNVFKLHCLYMSFIVHQYLHVSLR